MRTFQERVQALGLDSWKLVYQGGHHNVFCDGKYHAWTNGGYTECSPMSVIGRVGKCDCERWKQPWNKEQQ